VVDEYGDPVQNANVQILGASSDSQPVAGFGQSMFGSTDDRGEFRFITGPGRYYLQVQPRNFTQDRTPEIRTDGSSAAPYSTTFYPGTANKTQASVVEVGPGQDVTALEIRLTRSTETTRYLNISGIVTGVPEGERATVSLRSGESADALYNGNTSSAGQDGKFSFPNLEPKYYRLVAQYSSGKVHLQSQSVDFHLTSADAAGVQLVLAPGEDLTGSLEVTGVPAGAAAPKLSVHLDPADNYPSGNSQLTAAPAKDGSFRIGDVFPARYRVRVEPLPESAYIKSIALEGVPVEKDTVDLAHGVKGSRLKIAVALNGGQLSGKVLNHEGEPLVSPLAMLMVWKDAAQVEGDSHPISGGRYNLKGLRPGVYRILAVDVTELFDTLAPSNDEAAQKEMEKLLKAAAEEIEIKDGDQIVKDLRVVDKEKLDGKPKQ
jgi:hypothetical protein